MSINVYTYVLTYVDTNVLTAKLIDPVQTIRHPNCDSSDNCLHICYYRCVDRKRTGPLQTMCQFTIKTQLAKVTRFVVTAIAPVFIRSHFEIAQSNNVSHRESQVTDPGPDAIALVQTNDSANVHTNVMIDTRTNTDTYTSTGSYSTDVLTYVVTTMVIIMTSVYTDAIACVKTTPIPTTLGIVTGTFVPMTVATLAHVTVRGLAAIARKQTDSRSPENRGRAIAHAA